MLAAVGPLGFPFGADGFFAADEFFVTAEGPPDPGRPAQLPDLPRPDRETVHRFREAELDAGGTHIDSPVVGLADCPGVADGFDLMAPRRDQAP